MNTFTFSIVINTLNRGDALHNILESLQWQKYSGKFEVIVVNGPSTDNTKEVINLWQPFIRTSSCDVANLSVSRNIGICMAKGDLIAFIDDDAIPEPEWLEQLAERYKDPLVGAVGGRVYNHTGYDFQYEFCIVDRYGNPDLTMSEPTPFLAFPKSNRVPHLLGCNSSFRRSALLEISGFDEEFEYFLDETDVCLRIVDAGYIIVQLNDAYVHHKYAPSNIRGDNKIVKNRYPIIKNKIYFIFKHAKEFFSLEQILKEQLKFIEAQRIEVQWATKNGLLTLEDLNSFESDVQKAIEVGLKRGVEGVTADAKITKQKLKKYEGNFYPFTSLKDHSFKSIILISRDYPPNHGGGIATFNKDLAESLSALGNIVHVITQSKDCNRVDFENGVWLHRIKIKEYKAPQEVISGEIPSSIWNWSATALEEAKRISTHRKIDVIEAPIWDCEGIAFLLDGNWPLVTSLQTTLHFWLLNHSHYLSNEKWMTNFANPMLIIEKLIMMQSHAVRSISRAIAHEIENAYHFQFAENRVMFLPLGLTKSSENIYQLEVQKQQENHCEILFVGRLEYRKGIDVLLNSIPMILKVNPFVTFKIIGNNELTGEENRTYMELFLEKYGDQPWINKVKFLGQTDQITLLSAYKECDIFVAPSRFESFGLIYLEAMREGKPVIACSVGGVPEIIEDQVNGILIEPNNEAQLVHAINFLVADSKLRKKMGLEGFKRFNERFTAQEMALKSQALYDLAKLNSKLVL